jgi:hypothetical protein
VSCREAGCTQGVFYSDFADKKAQFLQLMAVLHDLIDAEGLDRT